MATSNHLPIAMGDQDPQKALEVICSAILQGTAALQTDRLQHEMTGHNRPHIMHSTWPKMLKTDLYLAILQAQMPQVCGCATPQKTPSYTQSLACNSQID